jgi:hypothetical protein
MDTVKQDMISELTAAMVTNIMTGGLYAMQMHTAAVHVLT